MIPVIPNGEYQNHVQRVQKLMQEMNLDAVLCYANSDTYCNVHYLTRYWPLFEVAGVLLGRTGEPLIMIGGEAPEYAGQCSPFGMKTVRPCETFGHPISNGAIGNWVGVEYYSLKDLFDEVTGGKGAMRVGLPDMGVLPKVVYDEIIRSCPPGVELIDCGAEIDDLRMNKTDWEVEMVRQACLISEKAFDEALGKINPEMTEYELEGVLAAELYKNGGEGPSFPVMCYSGYRSRMGIGRSTHNVLGRDTVINIDIGCHFGGYASEYGRPIVFGKMSDKTKRELDFLLELHEKLICEWVKPGVTSGEVYAKFYDAFVNNGYNPPVASGSHGVGIFEGEAPAFRRNIPTILRPNMTIAGDHFFRSDDYGFRVSDCYRITETGTELFTRSHWDYIEL